MLLFSFLYFRLLDTKCQMMFHGLSKTTLIHCFTGSVKTLYEKLSPTWQSGAEKEFLLLRLEQNVLAKCRRTWSGSPAMILPDHSLGLILNMAFH